MADDTRQWTGATQPAEPGWRVARRDLVEDGERRRIVAVARWGVVEAGAAPVPLSAAGERLDAPGLVRVAPPGTPDPELWADLHRSAAA